EKTDPVSPRLKWERGSDRRLTRGRHSRTLQGKCLLGRGSERVVASLESPAGERRGGSMSAQIVIVTGPDKGRSFPLPTDEPLQVGRSQTTPTKLTDQTVSRVHCQIDFDGNRAVLTNISANGTTVNGKAVTKHELRHGDLVRVGVTEFRFQLA